MSDPDSPLSQIPGSDWQLLGDLELPLGTNPQEAILSWMTKLLVPLALPPDFIQRLLLSAQNSIVHALAAGARAHYDHIHLVVHAPKDHGEQPGTWGFFHVEKNGNGAEEISAFVHSIEFYLYKEVHAEIV